MIRVQGCLAFCIVMAIVLVGCGPEPHSTGSGAVDIRGWSANRHDDPVTDAGRGPLALGLDAEILGACEDEDSAGRQDGAIDDVAPPSALFHRVEGWHRFGPDDELTFDATEYTPSKLNPIPMVRLSLGHADTVRGNDHEDTVLAALHADRIPTAQQAGAGIYLGALVDATYGEYLTAMVVAVVDEDIAVIGDCEYEWHTRPLEAFADAREESVADTFEGLAQGTITPDEYSVWEEGPPDDDPRDLAVWEQLPPDLRHLDPELTPEEILAQTASIALYLDVDATGIDSGTLLCVRSEQARSGCFDLASAGQDLFPFLAFTDVPLAVYLAEEQIEDGSVTDLRNLTELPPAILEEVAASGSTDQPAVIRLCGLDDAEARAGRAELDMDIMPLDQAEDAIFRGQSGR